MGNLYGFMYTLLVPDECIRRTRLISPRGGKGFKDHEDKVDAFDEVSKMTPPALITDM